MVIDSAMLAQSITLSGSKQTYYTTKLLVDKDLEQDCFRAYAYFRWVDDYIDEVASTREERISFIDRQFKIVELMYNGISPDEISPKETIIRDLIKHHPNPNSGLRTFIDNFLAIIKFDAQRKGQIIDQKELNWYTERLGESVTECIQYFIHNGHNYPRTESQYLAASAAHITHMLRDLSDDLSNGFINIPREYLDQNNLNPSELNLSDLREWVKERVILARSYFREGKKYIDTLEVLRCKIAGHLYSARFEGILDTIERDNYTLRKRYESRSRFAAWLNMASLSLRITFSHILRKR